MMLPYRIMPDGVQGVMTTKWAFFVEPTCAVFKIISVT